MSKSKILKRNNVKNRIAKIKHILLNKYYELFMNSGRFPELTDEQNHFAMSKLYSDGRFAIWKIKHTDEPGLAPFAEIKYNMYMLPEEIQLINLMNVSSAIIPTTPFTVNEDAVIIWYSENHKGAHEIIEYYVDRLVQIEMIINTNLNVQKMPFVIKGTNENIDKLKDLLDRVLNDEIVITADTDGLQNLEVLQTGAPLIITELYQYKKDVENELLTYMGFNNISFEKKERLITDEANANNDFIEMSDDAHTDEISRGCERASKYLGIKLSFKSKFDELAEKAEKNFNEKNINNNEEGDNNENV